MMTDISGLLRGAREDLARGFGVRAGTRLRQAAQEGSSEALDELCSALLAGRIPGGVADARRWLERPGVALDPGALLLRAGLRYSGVGGPAFPSGALQDLSAAATAGLGAARIETALLWQEHLDEESQSIARAWLRLASAQEPEAEELLGLLGQGRDSASTAPLERMATAGGHAARSRLHAEPRIERYSAVLKPVECAWLRMTARPHLAPSRVIDPATGTPQANPVRTSEAMCFDPAKPGIFALRLAARLAALAGCELARAEPLAVLHYLPGQEYKPHHDGLGAAALARDPLRKAGERAATVLAWLMEPEAGGATVFPQLGLRAKPITGDALVFFNLDPSGRPSPLALHAGEPVAAGEKWLASLWLRERPIPFN